MTAQERKAETLRALHHEPAILVLTNVSTVAQAVLLSELSECRAIATSSADVANQLGYPDGERISRDEMLDIVRRITAAVDLPVTADLEAGYRDAGGTARAAWEAGAVGLNLEDSAGSADEHVERVRAARASVPAIVINARTDHYLVGRPDFDETVRRGKAYLDAGADCVFVPGVSDADTIGRLVEAIPGPVNVLATGATPSVPELERLGVARVSVGSGLGRASLTWFRDRAAELLDGGSFDALSGAVTHGELGGLLADRLESTPATRGGAAR